MGGFELLGGVVLLGEVASGGLLLGLVVLGEVELLGLLMSGDVLLLGGVVVLGEVLLLGEVELLGLLTSLCGMVPLLLLQSDEIIFTLLTLKLLELEDEGLVLPVAVPAALPLADEEPVTWII